MFGPACARSTSNRSLATLGALVAEQFPSHQRGEIDRGVPLDEVKAATNVSGRAEEC